MLGWNCELMGHSVIGPTFCEIRPSRRVHARRSTEILAELSEDNIRLPGLKHLLESGALYPGRLIADLADPPTVCTQTDNAGYDTAC
jgi:hypothetical protein